jgi:uncharacterized RDD family membrane protein YckC
MKCPRCLKDTLNSDGICTACDFREEKTPLEMETAGSPSGNAGEGTEKAPAADTAPNQGEETLPPWRQELSQKLAALKQKKDAADGSGRTRPENGSPAASPAQGKPSARGNASPRKRAATPARKQAASNIQFSAASTPRIEPQQRTIASLGPDVFGTGAAAQASDSRDIRDLIDSAIAKQSGPAQMDMHAFREETDLAPDSKWILLSRSLSSVIDLLIIALCAGVFLISADYASGVVVWDILSTVEYSVLFLFIYFLYSIFFLAASGQTIGMMITDLRIIRTDGGIYGNRPSIRQLFIRCLAFIPSAIVFGIGLLWSFFDEGNRCFHDRISRTSVTRL